jgi:hypothetical protein
LLLFGLAILTGADFKAHPSRGSPQQGQKYQTWSPRG